MNLRNIITSLETPVLLEGRPGLCMLEDVQEFVGSLLQMDNYELHPDYCFIDLPDKKDKKEKKKTIGVEDVLVVLQKSATKPVLFEKTVVVINHMDCLTKEAQNKLLLSLENSPYLFIIGISYGDGLLDTVLSRMRKVSYQSSSQKDFMDFCAGTYSAQESLLLYHACNGCIGLINELSSHLPLYQALYDACMGDNRADILSALHLVKEKDKLAVTNQRELLTSVLTIAAYCFFERSKDAFLCGDTQKAVRYSDIVERLFTDQRLSRYPAYTKDDFFCTICYCVEH